MNYKILIMPFVLSILLAVNVTATGNYSNFGGDDYTYELGRGLFNLNLDFSDTIPIIKNFDDLRLTPLVEDLDNDGINEIIVISDDTIFLYQNSELTFVDSYDLGSPQTYSNMIAYDIDGDGIKEVIVAFTNNGTLVGVDYNGSRFQKDFTYHLNNHTDGDIVLGCRGTDDCAVFYSQRVVNVLSSNSKFIGAFFNSTDISGFTQIYVPDPSKYETLCLPNINNLAVSDYDLDGDYEYIVVTSLMTSDNDDALELFWMDVDPDVVTTEVYVEEDDIYEAISNQGGASCSSVRTYFSPPLVMDAKDTAGLETIVAYQPDYDEFEMQLYEADGSDSIFDIFPQVLNGDGDLVSNVFKAHVFGGSGGRDFCVIGYFNPSQQIDILCGSKFSSETYESYIFSYDTSVDGYNVTYLVGEYSPSAHSTQQTNNQDYGEDFTEVACSYGILELDWDSCGLLGYCDALRIFPNGLGRSVLLSVDAEQFGSEDLLAMSTTQLAYIDDGLGNEPALITSVSYNPCPFDNILKVNTTMSITVIVEDQNNAEVLLQDDVASNVTIYKDNLNEMSDQATGVNSGDAVIYYFILNQTGTNYEISVLGWDEGNPLIVDEQTATFTVGVNGLEYGDIACTRDYVSAEEEEETANIVETELDSNVITTSVNEIGGILGLSGLLIWMIVMAVVAYGIWNYTAKTSATFALGTIIIMEFLMLIIGYKLQFITFGILLAVVLVVVMIIGILAALLFFGR